jgi:hypothetical protein
MAKERLSAQSPEIRLSTVKSAALYLLRLDKNCGHVRFADFYRDLNISVSALQREIFEAPEAAACLRRLSSSEPWALTLMSPILVYLASSGASLLQVPARAALVAYRNKLLTALS